MPKFLKDQTIKLIEGGIESYILALYGMQMPNLVSKKNPTVKFAPVLGLLGAATELLAKACLVQAKGAEAMYIDGDIKANVYKNASEVLKELKTLINNDDVSISFLWKEGTPNNNEKQEFSNYLDKFRLLNFLRAAGLHAAEGCKKDIVVTTANDIYSFIKLLSNSKKMKSYLKNVPAPESATVDREAIIEDLARRIKSSKDTNETVGYLRNMFIVLPYVPEIEPEWIEHFEKVSLVEPNAEDVSYLVKTVNNAHSLFLLKSRGGKTGLPVRVDNDNPDALPMQIEKFKRKLTNINDKFYNDILTANTRLEENRLDLPIEGFLNDIFDVGLKHVDILEGDVKLTAEQAWPFVVAAMSTAGTPRPCFEFIKECDEIDKLISILKKVEGIANGYYKRRVNSLIKMIKAIQYGKYEKFGFEKDNIFNEIQNFKYNRKISDQLTPSFIKENVKTETTKLMLEKVIKEEYRPGEALEKLLESETISEDDRVIARKLKDMCSTYEDRNGLIVAENHTDMRSYRSEIRKKLFFIDVYYNGGYMHNKV